MKRLIIAEKPGLARIVCKAIETEETAFKSQDGFYENDNYVVSYAIGHLFGLTDLNDYIGKEKKAPWELTDIPYVPDDFKFKLKDDSGLIKQYKTLEKLVKRDDVNTIIHCGDAGREGEVIVRLILNNTNTTKPVLRLWLPDQADSTILKQLKEMKSDNEYDNLYNEGLARTYMDWSYGINFTRLLTVKHNALMPCGRVLVPIVKAIYDRCKEIDTFVKTKYFQAEYKAKFDDREIVLTCPKKFENKSEAEVFCSDLNKYKAEVIDVKKEDIEKQPGKLFSLTKLQNQLSKLYKMSMKESLDIVQQLYEKGYVTYPRTNTEYLSTNEKEKMGEIINELNNKGYVLALNDSKRIFDNSKIEDHSALTPTLKMPSESDLSEVERKVYDTILKRFLCVFLAEKTIATKTTILIKVNNEEFKITGEAIKQEGFLKYEKMSEKFLPVLNVGDSFEVHFTPAEKETKPPAKHTVITLNKFLENPFKKEEKSEPGSDDEEYKNLLAGIEIGTGATRTPIIENAKRYGYISEEKSVYSIENKGKTLISLLEKLNINLNKEKSVELNKTLKKVYKGELTLDEVVSYLQTEITDMVNTAKGVEVEKAAAPVRESIGKCPKCGKPVYENSKAFSCSGYKDGCKFALWKEDKFLGTMNKKITASIAKNFLSNGQANIKGLKSKNTGKIFDATIKVDFSAEYPKYMMEFAKKGKK